MSAVPCSGMPCNAVFGGPRAGKALGNVVTGAGGIPRGVGSPPGGWGCLFGTGKGPRGRGPAPRMGCAPARWGALPTRGDGASPGDAVSPEADGPSGALQSEGTERRLCRSPCPRPGGATRCGRAALPGKVPAPPAASAPATAAPMLPPAPVQAPTPIPTAAPPGARRCPLPTLTSAAGSPQAPSEEVADGRGHGGPGAERSGPGAERSASARRAFAFPGEEGRDGAERRRKEERGGRAAPGTGWGTGSPPPGT